MAADQTNSPCLNESRTNRRGRQILDACFLTILAIVLSGCAANAPLDDLALYSGLKVELVATGHIPLRALRNTSLADKQSLAIYIGGDGQPWSSNEPAANPDGAGVLAAELALRDARPAYYLGRPCYHWVDMPSECGPEMWTSHRYSNDTVEQMASAVSKLLDRESTERAELIGYSGGGVLALLIAAQLDSVTRVSTIAANLDTTAWTRFHNLLPLTGSLNPADSLESPTPFEQIHLTGTGDKVVPVATISNFRDRHPEAVFLEVEGFYHRCCWVEQWPGILDYINRDIEALKASSVLPSADRGDR